ncbi:MAG: hypothetical protein Q4C95_08445, partial [Planctomycetia bacterium]|nr:hypothetical protein [Planctomycetia bacterium]
IYGAGSLAVENLTITNGSSAGIDGGVIYIQGTLSMADSTLMNGYAGRYGGAIYTEKELNLTNVNLINNEAGEKGGALFNNGGVVTITKSTIDANKAEYAAGIMNNGDNRLELIESEITNNVASVSAGGIDNYGELVINNSTLSGNIAETGDGGAIYNNSGYLVIISEGTIIESNTAISGGGIYNSESGTVSLSVATIKGNSSSSDGGGIYNAKSGSLTFDQVNIEENIAGRNAGALYSNGTVDFVFANQESEPRTTIFKGNNAMSLGGAVYVDFFGKVYGTSVEFRSNISGENGGAVFNSGTFVLSNSIVAGNSALYGGAFYNVNSMFLRNTSLGGNGFSIMGENNKALSVASLSGGAIYNTKTLTLNNTVVAQNFGRNGTDIYTQDTAVTNVAYSLIGSTVNSGKALNDLGNNILGVDSELIDPLYVTGPYTEETPETGVPASNGQISLTRLAALNLKPQSDSSPVINAGNNDYALDAKGNVLVYDFEANKRIESFSVDMGAYELEFEKVSYIVTTLQDVSNKTDGLISLREAIAYANELCENDATGYTVTFDYEAIIQNDGLSSSETEFVFVLNEELLIAFCELDGASLTIDHTNTDYKVIIQAGVSEESFTDRCFKITHGEVTLRNLALTGGYIVTNEDYTDIRPFERINVSGAAVCNSSVKTVTIDHCAIYDNFAMFGGSIFNDFGNMEIIGSTIQGNTAVHSIIYNTGTMTVTGSNVSGNASDHYGGAFANYASLDIVNSLMAGNRSEYGGAVFNAGDLSMTNVTIAGNQATLEGGGIWSDSSSKIYNSIIAKNKSPKYADIFSAVDMDIQYSLVEKTEGAKGFTTGEANNLSADPLFVKYSDYSVWTKNLFSSWNLSLKQTSAAIDAGDNFYAIDAGLDIDAAFDIAGKTRFVAMKSEERIIDFGAYEFQGNTAPTDIVAEQLINDLATAVEGAVILSLSTTDSLGDEHTYEFVPGEDFDNDDFTIVDNKVKANKALEERPYSIQVRSTDQGGLSVDKVISFEIIDSTKTPFVAPVIENISADHSSITLSWNCVDAGNVKEYRVRYAKVDAESQEGSEDWIYYPKTFLGTEGSFVADRVESGERYVFQIQAVGRDNYSNSDWSEKSDPILIEIETPTVIASRVGVSESPLVHYQIQTSMASSFNTKIQGMVVNWGDGSSTVLTGTDSGNLLHYYTEAGAYCISVQLIQGSTAQRSKSFYLGTHVITELSVESFVNRLSILSDQADEKETVSQDVSIETTVQSATNLLPTLDVSNVIVADQISSDSRAGLVEAPLVQEKAAAVDLSAFSEVSDDYIVHFVRGSIPQSVLKDQFFHSGDLYDFEWDDVELELPSDSSNNSFDDDLLESLNISLNL